MLYVGVIIRNFTDAHYTQISWTLHVWK